MRCFILSLFMAVICAEDGALITVVRSFDFDSKHYVLRINHDLMFDGKTRYAEAGSVISAIPDLINAVVVDGKQRRLLLERIEVVPVQGRLTILVLLKDGESGQLWYCGLGSNGARIDPSVVDFIKSSY